VGALAVAFGAFAQSEEPRLVVNLDGLRYPPIARQARIRGDVAFEVSALGRKLMSESSLLLSRPAQENLATWTLPPLETGRYLISYHFDFVEEGGMRQVTVPIGNKFERIFRRLFRAPTTRIVSRCYDGRDADPPPRYTAVQDGDVKIDVFVGSVAGCLQTEEASQVALNSHL